MEMEKAIDVRTTATQTSGVRTVQTILFVLLSGLCADAQNTPRFELFAGYSLFSAATQQRNNLSGAQINIKFSLRPSAAIAIDAGGQFRSDPSLPPRPGLFILNFHDRYVHFYQLFAGPEFTRRGGASDLFVHTLAGDVHTDGNNFAALSLGGGFVFHRQKKVGLRVQLDYVPNRGGGYVYHDLRIGTGVVFRKK